MTLHLPTLLLLDICVLALLGALMLHAWRRSENEATLGWMAGMLLLASLGTLVVSLRGIGMDSLSIVLGQALLRLAAGFGWTAMRVFAGRRPCWPAIVGGALLWALLCLWPHFMSSLPWRVTIVTLLTVLYSVMAAWELWRARRQLQAAILPAVALSLMHALFCASLLLVDSGQAIERVWSGLDDSFVTWRLLEAFLFAIGIAFVTLAMVRERAEVRLRAVANCDPLTGIGNRRAFMASAEALLADCRRTERPAALLLCDLDHFKLVNDRHGHAMGDAALIGFGRVLSQSIRQSDVCGRIGGEEFACLLPDANAAQAELVAERIRLECSELMPDPALCFSVSIGVAEVAQAGYELPRLLALADQALYRAKANGRNRVEHYAAQPLPA
ncbi:diguanylate cyclase (GGDEF) domain-containing protein [Geopseudomonas sagittaria]|uniref:diguanylate cyclase n=1 Tax=Geopseudomonas sagittaria TaxID=1135990 RepID=A0A1I5TYX8_9GAMM|nr:GGDEF domain-containing protein [Pseudomonas sagittaria]SFP88244.1 diguanylate cyclase (GGDEF) domain-containing protein [Pseudomonas sagittaria]